MKTKSIFLIISVIVIIIGINLIIFKRDYNNTNNYQKFFSDLEKNIDNVSKIEIENSQNIFYLLKNNSKWILPSYDGYPA